MKGPGFSYHRDQLPNGLTVVTVETPHLHSALLTVYVRAGSRHEPPELMGVSHFLEHMFFRGSARYPDTVRMNALVEAVGGNLNGMTARDHGYYDTPLHPDELEVGFDVLGDMLRAPRLEGVAVERKIILEEMSDELDERGRDVDLDNLSKRALFPGHGLSHKIAGTRASVRRIARADLVARHARTYTASNLVVACAGRVTRGRVRALAAKHFGGFPRGRPVKDARPRARRDGPRLHHVRHDVSPQSELRLNFFAPPEGHRDHLALRIARRVLDDGLSSRLPYELVEKRGLAYDVRAEIDAFHDVAVFELEAATSHANVPAVIALMGDLLAALRRDGPTRDELERARRRHAIGLEQAADSCGDLLHWFGRTELWRRAESFASRRAALDAVTADDVRRACARVFTRANLQAVLVGRASPRGLAKLRALVAALPL